MRLAKLVSNIIIAPAIHFKVNGQRERWTAARLSVGYKLILDWPISIHLKFLLICVAVTGILLVIYQLGVRYTPIGTMLNGKRVRGA